MHCISNYQGKSFAAPKPFPIINHNVYNKMGIQVTLLYTLKFPTPKKKKYTLKEKNKFVEAAARDIAETSVFILKSWQRWAESGEWVRDTVPWNASSNQ